MMHFDPMAPRVPYARPASHKGHSAYAREIYAGRELDYRGKPAPIPQDKPPCKQPS